MKKSLKVVLVLTLALVLVFSLAACGQKAASLEKLDQSEMTFEKLGEQQILTAKLSEGVLEKDIVWASEDEAVVKVGGGNERCVVTAMGQGQTNVTAKLGDKTVTCKVTVAEVGVSLSVKESVMSIDLNGTANIEATVTTATVYQSKTVSYASSDATVATVDATGKVTAKKAGAAIITVTTDEGFMSPSGAGGMGGDAYTRATAKVYVVVGQEKAMLQKLAGKYSDAGIYWVGSADNATATLKDGKYTLKKDAQYGYVKSWVDLTIKADGSFSCVANGVMRSQYHAVLNSELAEKQAGVADDAVVGYFTAQPFNRATQVVGDLPAGAKLIDEKGNDLAPIDGMKVVAMQGTAMGFKHVGAVAVIKDASNEYDIFLVGVGNSPLKVGHFKDAADLDKDVSTYLTYDQFGKTVGNGNFGMSVSAKMNRKLTIKTPLAA